MDTTSTNNESAPEMTPSQPTPVVQTVSQKPRKRRTGLFLFTLLLVTLLAGGAGYVLNDYLKTNSSDQTETPATTQTNTTKNTSSPDIRALLTEASKLVEGGQVEQQVAAPDYQPAGYDFAAQAPRSKSYDIVAKRLYADIPAVETKLKNFLTDKSFKAMPLPQEFNSDVVPIPYESSDTVCGISRPSMLQDDKTLNEIALSCAPKAAYVETAKVQAPFYKAYRAAEAQSKMSVSMPRIIDSRTEGFKMAEVGLYNPTGVGGAMGLFYQTPDQKWHFFVGTQQIVPCDAFKTTDLKKAYFGERCWDTTRNAENSVQL